MKSDNKELPPEAYDVHKVRKFLGGAISELESDADLKQAPVDREAFIKKVKSGELLRKSGRRTG